VAEIDAVFEGPNGASLHLRGDDETALFDVVDRAEAYLRAKFPVEQPNDEPEVPRG
jgi:hypothetical protein